MFVSSAAAVNSVYAAQAASQKTMDQIATGKAVNKSSDNMALWATATANYSESGVLSAVTTSQQGEAMPMISASETAIGGISDVMNSMRDNLVALQGGGDQNATLASLQAQGQALNQAVSAAGLDGVNMLDASTSSSGGSRFMLAYSEYQGGGQTSSLQVNAASLTSSSGSTGLLQNAQAAGSSQASNFTALTANDVSAANIAQTLNNLNAAQSQVEAIGGALGGDANLVGQANSAAVTKQDNIANGTAATDQTDMGAASTQLAASNVSAQLAILATSIANRSSASVLRLFQQNGSQS
jgi:flagellin